MSDSIRVRFAPSPTGPLHMGGVRTALFNYLFAKKHKGTFVLRIEDTDQNRYVSNAEQYIVDALNWSGIPFDEGPGKEGAFGPYRQSERKELYKKYADQLIQAGKAYYAFDTPEALDAHRQNHQEKGKTFIYNWHNREKLDNSLNLSPQEVQKKIDAAEPYVIRFKCPEEGTIVLDDVIRGQINIDAKTLDDKILFKSDGMPTYHLANIVDDHLMEISHVIRGEEWLPSLALHHLLYQAFDWTPPVFAHLPLILKPTGKGKLSKRDGDKLGFPVFPLAYTNPDNQEVSRGYREDGYFPEAFVNMLAFLGWNPGTEQELFSLSELIAAFDLQKVGKSGSKFDLEKTKWFQHQYLVRTSDSRLSELFLEAFGAQLTTQPNADYLETVISMVKERATFVEDLWPLSHYFFQAPKSFDEKAAKKAWKAGSAELMRALAEHLDAMDSFEASSIETEVRAWIQAKELGFGKVMQPLRLSLVGAMQGPDVYQIATLLGQKETLNRIHFACDTLAI